MCIRDSLYLVIGVGPQAVKVGVQLCVALAEPEEGRLLLATEKHPEGREFDLPETPAYLADPIAHFLNGIETDTPFQDLCHPVPCRDAQEILQAGAESATTGAKVALPQAEN